MQLICKYNKGIKFLLCAIDLFSKYAWVVPLKDKKVLLIHFKKFLTIQKESEIEFGLIKAVNFTILF